MEQRFSPFAGDDPFELARDWLAQAELQEPNDANAVALATVDAAGLPNARIVLLKDIEADAFVFYTNYGSQKARELDTAKKAAFVIHWKSLRRQIRVRGDIIREEGTKADAYFKSRPAAARIGAWASRQSEVLENREDLIARAERLATDLGDDPDRPEFWGGYRLQPLEIEFWQDGVARLHDRFRWLRENHLENWKVDRLNP